MTTPCTFPECGSPAKARGLCSGHYQQQRNGRPLTPLRRQLTSRPEHACDCLPSARCYSHHGCRCEACCAAHSRRHKAWRLAGPALVDPTGTIRRLRALCRVGWSRPEIGTFLGLNRASVQALLDGRAKITRRTRANVAAAYDAHWQGPPHPVSRADRLRRSRARQAAIRHGWDVPMAWDDGTGPHGIDNPDATPYIDTHTGAVETVAEKARWLYDGGLRLAAILHRLDTTKDALWAAVHRTDPDLWVQLTRDEAA